MSEKFQLKISVKDGNQAVMSKVFKEFPLVFGRSSQCHIQLAQFTAISGVHGTINVQGRKIIVADLDSKNGILYKDEPKSLFEVEEFGSFSAGGLTFQMMLEALPDEKKPAKPVVIDSTSQETVVTGKVAAPVGDLTRISSRLRELSQGLRLEVDSDLSTLSPHDISLQGIITWGDDILDVRQFKLGDELIVGGNQMEPIYLPSVIEAMNFGRYAKGRGVFFLKKDMKWRLSHGGYDFAPEAALQKNLIEDKGKGYKFKLDLKDVCSIDLGDNVSLHMRYVQVPRPLVARTWIENKEIFKRAILISLSVHLMFSMGALLSAPKVVAPKVDNVPPRFAKLLVAPPNQILAPKPEPIVIPTPPPMVKMEPVKIPEPKLEPIQKKQKPVKKIVKKQPEEIPQPMKTAAPPKPAAPTKTAGPPEPAKAPPKPAGEEAANSFADVFNSAPAKPTTGPSKVKIDATVVASNKQVKTSGLVGSLKSQVGESSSNIGESTSLGKQAGQQGYDKSVGGSAGKRGVGGAVLGTPKFDAPTTPQGLKNDEVMKVVNKSLGDVHRCYERALFQDSNLVGRVEYEWNISPAGDVTSASVKRSEMGNADFLNNCVLGVLRKLKFPRATNNQSTIANIGFPFGKN